MSIEFHPMAMRDLLDAQIYYRDIDHNLGVDFRHQINETIFLIQANPERFHFLSPKTHLRRANLTRFPFHLVYEVNELTRVVRVQVVRHDRRHPTYGLSRRWL
jgi:plasmid stabilization system protein ParE